MPLPSRWVSFTPSAIQALSLTHQMRILQLIHDRDVIELDVQVLVDALQGAADQDVVLELDRHLVLDQSLEEAEEEHGGRFLAGGVWRSRRVGENVIRSVRSVISSSDHAPKIFVLIS